MKTLALACTALFGWWFWRTPAHRAVTEEWPAAMPQFAEGRAGVAYSTPAGSAFVHIDSAFAPEAALDSAANAFAAAGWAAADVRTRDSLIFMKGDLVAAVLALPRGHGSMITAVISPVLRQPRP